MSINFDYNAVVEGFIVVRDDEEIELSIYGYGTPYVPDNFRGHPDNWCPSEGGDMDILYIEDEATGKASDITLTKEEEDEAIGALQDALEQAVKEDAEEWAIDAYESSRDYGYDF